MPSAPSDLCQAWAVLRNCQLALLSAAKMFWVEHLHPKFQRLFLDLQEIQVKPFVFPWYLLNTFLELCLFSVLPSCCMNLIPEILAVHSPAAADTSLLYYLVIYFPFREAELSLSA